jgi:hypothetical protein
MGLLLSLAITATGLILALAVHPTNPGSVNVNTVGWILFVVGLVGFMIDMVLWQEHGAATYVRRRVGYEYPRRPRRTIVEEEDVPGPPPGY